MSETTTAPRAAGGPNTVHPVDEVLPAQRLFILGLQHLFIMYAGAVAVPLIVGPAVGLNQSDIGILVSCDLLISGIASVIQSVGIGKIMGVRLPVVAGATFTVLNPMIIIATQYGGGANGMRVVYGAILCSGVFGLLIAKPFSMILRFFPPLVTGTVISVIGLSLIGADISLIAGQQYSTDFKTGALTPLSSFGTPSHIALAGLVILLIVLVTRFTTGFVSQIAVLIAIVVGTIVAWPMGGMIHWGSAVSNAKWFGIAEPFHFGGPKFQAAAIVSMCIVMLVTYTESTADMLAVAEMVDKDLTPNDLARGLATDGLSGLLAGFMNSFPDTAYAENVGLIGMTKVKSRWVVTVCGALLIVLGIIPKVGQLVAGLPEPVIGGAATVMFAMVTSIGIRTLHKVEFEDNHNLLIVATALAVGLLPAFNSSLYEQFPDWFQTIFGSAITSTVIVVFVLNLLFNHWNAPPVAGTNVLQEAMEHGAVSADDGDVPEPPHSRH
jgi:xanthine permease